MICQALFWCVTKEKGDISATLSLRLFGGMVNRDGSEARRTMDDVANGDVGSIPTVDVAAGRTNRNISVGHFVLLFLLSVIPNLLNTVYRKML